MITIEYLYHEFDNLVRVRQKGWAHDMFEVMSKETFTQFKSLCYPFSIQFVDITNKE